ncbi:MAG: ATP synthase F1 subunit delta [Flavobacteriales bacterium]|nr:ATP synthase F1 subunit delta [Flavobacteriales bacterium]
MKDIKVASRYAKSLLGIAIENNCLEAVQQDMFLIATVCKENRELQNLLKSSIVRGDKKLAVLKTIFSSINNISVSFIKIIVDKKREAMLFDIATAFVEAYKLHKNIKTAYVTSAVLLTVDQKEQIKKLIATTYNSTIEFEEVIDPSIIGGIVLRIGDKQVDQSIKRKLQNLAMEFEKNPYQKEY